MGFEKQPTSIDAYRSILPMVNRHQREILEIFMRDLSRNWTNRELAEEKGVLPCNISPRVTELCKKGYLVHDETRVCSSQSGRKVMAWAMNKNETLPPLVRSIPSEIVFSGGKAVLKYIVDKKRWTEIDKILREKGYAYQGDGIWKREKDD